MARSFSIVQINQSGGPGVPGTITVPGDLVSSFQGKFFREDAPPHGTLPGYTVSPPVGYTQIRATTFTIEENESYAGRYTVYTPIDALDEGVNPSSSFDGLNTLIRVNEIIGPPVNIGDESGVGIVTNISTYVIALADDAGAVTELVIPPAVSPSDLPIELIGRFGSPWGEGYTQNFVDLAQNFARGEPADPILGQTWYDHANGLFKLRGLGGNWVTIGSAVPTSYRHEQVSSDDTWVITHGLNLAAPYIAFVQFFVLDAGVYKLISPLDLTFDTANQLTVTFSVPRTGFALIRV